MTDRDMLTDWLASRTPAPPPPLAERITSIVARSHRSVDAVPTDALLDAGENAMRTVLADGCLTRPSAMELLAVDAVVTYAFEAAADDPAQLEDRAAEALARIAALAAPYEA